MSQFKAAALATFLGLALVAPATAETPCDVLRSYLRNIALREPGVSLVNQALEPLTPKPDGNAGENCADLAHALPGIDVDPSELSAQAMTCDLGLDFYDERNAGGFVFLVGPEGGSGGCTYAATLLIDANHAHPDWDWDACMIAGSSWIQPLRLNGVLYPTTIDAHTRGPELGYELTLMSVRPPDECKVSITYQPHYRVENWFGPKGENDIAPSLRAALEPILLERMAGRDGWQAAEPWLDHAAGDSVYDAFLARHPTVPIADFGPDDPDDFTYHAVYFAPDDMMYTELKDDVDLVPLRIEGRRFLLAFGFPSFGWRVAQDPAFGLLEWTGSQLIAIAGGYLGKTGDNPKIE
jgi:hypothetical protein